jgi:hypothetical protein
VAHNGPARAGTGARSAVNKSLSLSRLMRFRDSIALVFFF